MNFIIENKGGNCHPYFFTCDLQFIYKISNNIVIKWHMLYYIAQGKKGLRYNYVYNYARQKEY